VGSAQAPSGGTSPGSVNAPQGAGNLPSTKGLLGKDFEDYLTKNIGGSGGFKLSGRQFDGGVGNRWREAKTGDYWNKLNNNPKEMSNFKSSMGQRLGIAKEKGATFELFSNSPILQSILHFCPAGTGCFFVCVGGK
jgi:hypothetical protein